MLEIMLEAVPEILHNILFAVDDEDLTSDMEQFFIQSFDWIEGF